MGERERRRGEGGGLAEVEGGGVKGQLAGGGPEIQSVSVGAAGEAAVDLPGKTKRDRKSFPAAPLVNKKPTFRNSQPQYVEVSKQHVSI
jgi:hypothetical protein